MESRLAFALERGLFDVSTGVLAVWGAQALSDLTALPRDAVRIVQGYRPDVDALSAAGFSVGPEEPADAALGIVLVPRERARARAWIAAAARVSRGPVVVDGAKSDGIEGILRDLRKRAEMSDVLSKHHGKLAVLAPGADLSDWEDPGPKDIGGFVTQAGVFSADGVDPGSVLLADALPGDLQGRIVDLGAGWGYLSKTVLSCPGVRACHLVEADFTALNCARINVRDPRAKFHWADATRFDAATGFDAAVMNPPFHRGRTGDPGLGQAFIAHARTLLRKNGILWLVANRHLPYENTLATQFKEVAGIGGDRSFKLFRAARPRQSGA
ncbi:MAG: methyltransferase [Pseudomonadota bacterium]